MARYLPTLKFMSLDPKLAVKIRKTKKKLANENQDTKIVTNW